VENEVNLLVDGSLIDLCGATLLWRSAEGLAKGPVLLFFSKSFTFDVFALVFVPDGQTFGKDG